MGCAAGLCDKWQRLSQLCSVFSLVLLPGTSSAPSLICRPFSCSVTKPEKVHVTDLPPNMLKGIQAEAWINWGLSQHSLFALLWQLTR